MKSPAVTVTCTRCLNLPCSCLYEATTPRPISDSDIERIAQRVVELMRTERGDS